MYETLIIFYVLIACIGLLLYFVGWINTIFMALGNQQKIYAFSIFILNPLAIYYSLKNWQQAKTQAKQLIIGLLIMCLTIIPAIVYFNQIKHP